MMARRRTPWRLTALHVGCVVVVLLGLAPFTLHVGGAGAQPPEAVQSGGPFPASDQTPPGPSMPFQEIREALVRLPFAAVLGSALALRPRRRSQGPRSILVVQTQIMLAVVGAVIMLVVGNSLSRAFGIVGAAGLVRYRSTIDDPKEAVVMLCALAAGLACGVGLYMLAPFATLFMVSVLWVVEHFEPTARKFFELEVSMKGASAFRPTMEGVLAGFALEFELLTESDDEVSYSISAPIDVRTRDISDTLRLLTGEEEMSIEWDEKRPKK